MTSPSPKPVGDRPFRDPRCSNGSKRVVSSSAGIESPVFSIVNRVCDLLQPAVIAIQHAL
jgi:hypothetical protein